LEGVNGLFLDSAIWQQVVHAYHSKKGTVDQIVLCTIAPVHQLLSVAVYREASAETVRSIWLWRKQLCNIRMGEPQSDTVQKSQGRDISPNFQGRQVVIDERFLIGQSNLRNKVPLNHIQFFEVAAGGVKEGCS